MYRVFWAIWLLSVIVGSLINGSDKSALTTILPFVGLGRLTHYGAYTGLGFLSVLAFARPRGARVALGMILVGAAIEVAQNLSPGRTPAFLDALVNALGAISGIALASLLPSLPKGGIDSDP